MKQHPQIIEADLNRPEHQAAVRMLTASYALDPMGNGTPLDADAVSGRKITPAAGARRREGKRSPSCRNALTVWCAEPTRAKVSKKCTIVSRTCASGSRTTAPLSS